MLDYGPIETTKTRPKLPELYNSHAPVRKTAGRSIRIAKREIEDGGKNVCTLSIQVDSYTRIEGSNPILKMIF